MSDVVVIKLVTREVVICEVLDEDDYKVNISNPLILNSNLNRDEGGRMYESVSASPFCAFTSETEFTLDKSQIIYIKETSPEYTNTYLQLLDNQENEKKRALNSVEDIENLLDELAVHLGKTKEETSKEEVIVVEGNDTLH